MCNLESHVDDLIAIFHFIFLFHYNFGEAYPVDVCELEQVIFMH